MRLGDCRTACLSRRALQSVSSFSDEVEKPTRSYLHGLRVVIRNIVLNPFPIDVPLAFRLWVGVKPFRNFTVADQAGCHGNLQSKPIFGLSDVKNVSGWQLAGSPIRYEQYLPCVCCACCNSLIAVYMALMLDIPWLSSVASMSSFVIPKLSQYPMCNDISWWIWVTILAAWILSALIRGK